MAMEALKSLANNIPGWQKRLEDLNGQLEQRQVDLEKSVVAATQTTTSRSIRNVGSSESLKPNDDGPAHPSVDASDVSSPASYEPDNIQRELPAQAQSVKRATFHKQAREAVAANTRALMEAQETIPEGSVPSKPAAAAAATTEPSTKNFQPRARSAFGVYYDSYVQAFFDELVRFVSSNRNLMRKAKMASKVAQIKRMAEMEVASDADRNADERRALDALPSLMYMKTWNYGSNSGSKVEGEAERARRLVAKAPPDVYETMDKSLEALQSMCENAATRFLRDGECYEEIRRTLDRLGELLAAATKEKERVLREDPVLAAETGDTIKARMHRPISVRRDMTANSSIAPLQKRTQVTVQTPNGDTSKLVVHPALEVDPNLNQQELDEMLSTMQYQSTRLMRNLHDDD